MSCVACHQQQRQKRRRHGLANYRLIRYADDFVVLVTGEREQAQALRVEVATVLAPMGLRLAPQRNRYSVTADKSTPGSANSCGSIFTVFPRCRSSPTRIHLSSSARSVYPASVRYLAV